MTDGLMVTKMVKISEVTEHFGVCNIWIIQQTPHNFT